MPLRSMSDPDQDFDKEAGSPGESGGLRSEAQAAPGAAAVSLLGERRGFSPPGRGASGDRVTPSGPAAQWLGPWPAEEGSAKGPWRCWGPALLLGAGWVGHPQAWSVQAAAPPAFLRSLAHVAGTPGGAQLACALLCLLLRQPCGIGVLRVNTVFSAVPLQTAVSSVRPCGGGGERRQGGLRAGPQQHFCDGRPG